MKPWEFGFGRGGGRESGDSTRLATKNIKNKCSTQNNKRRQIFGELA